MQDDIAVQNIRFRPAGGPRPERMNIRLRRSKVGARAELGPEGLRACESFTCFCKLQYAPSAYDCTHCQTLKIELRKTYRTAKQDRAMKLAGKPF